MARRKQSELGDIATRDRILNSARKYFLEYGFQAAPLRKIAMDAGFTSGALYGYFDSKEALFYAITDPIAESLMKKLNEIREEMDAIPDKYRLKRMGSAYYHHISLCHPLCHDRCYGNKAYEDAALLRCKYRAGKRYVAKHILTIIRCDRAGKCHIIYTHTPYEKDDPPILIGNK